MKILLITIILLSLSINIASATCTTTLDNTDYQPGETVTATMSCSNNNERTQSYSLLWNNGTTLVETDTGTTPSIKNTPFFETYVIPAGSNWTDAFANLTGTNLEGIDYFNVSGTGSFILKITDTKFANTAYVGELYAVDYEVKDSNNVIVNNARCTVFGTDNSEAPLQVCGDQLTYAGRGVCSSRIDPTVFDENIPYLAKIRCSCGTGDYSCFDATGNSITNKYGDTAVPFTTNTHLSVNTITDKSIYALEDEIIVCANVTNTRDQRVAFNILYNFRCDSGSDTDTNRIVWNSYTERRGISANLTQTQCRNFVVPSERIIEKGNVNCYGATDIDVLNPLEEVSQTYSTISPVFNITISRVHPVTNWLRVSRESYWTNVSLNEFDGGLKEVQVEIHQKLTGDNTPATMVKNWTVTYFNGTAVPYATTISAHNRWLRTNGDVERVEDIYLLIDNVNVSLNESFNVTITGLELEFELNENTWGAVNTTGVAIKDDEITAAKIATDAIGSSEIASNAIGSSELATDAIGASELATDSITSDQLATSAADEIATEVWNESITNYNTTNTFGLKVRQTWFNIITSMDNQANLWNWLKGVWSDSFFSSRIVTGGTVTNISSLNKTTIADCVWNEYDSSCINDRVIDRIGS